jgi:hypothetical protein
MDVTEIAKALQTDLNFYKIKIQVKRKGSQLHVLTTRAEENDVDYSLLMELVRKNLEKLPLQDVNDFVIYGRVAGAKQPEWQEKVEISPQLPLIELDIEDDLDRELNFKPPVTSVSSAPMVKDSIDIDDLLPDLSDASIDADTDIFVRSRENSVVEKLTPSLTDALEAPASVSLQPPTLESYDYPELEEMHNDDPGVDFSDNGQNNGKSTSDVNVKKQPKPASTNPTTKKKFPVLPIALLAALLAGGGGLFLWDRSMQEQKIAEAREIVATVPDLKQLNKKEALNDAKSKLSSAIARLEEIPERPGSLFDEAQNELGLLRTKVTAIDKKLATPTVATNPPGKTNTPPPKKTDTPPVSKTTPPTTVPAKVDPTVKPPAKTDDLEAAAKHLGHEASVIVQNAPHKSEVWKSSQGKWQEAIALLEKLPKDTPQRASIDKRLGIYKQNLAQITTQLQKQQKVEGIIALLAPATQTELKQLKAKGTQKPQFITTCGDKIRSIPNVDEVETSTCEFLFKSL